MPNFVGGEPEWLKLNSDLPSLTTLKTVGDLEEGFENRLLRVRDFIFYLGSTTMDWRVLNVYLYYCDANGGFLPDRTIDQNGRIKRQGGGIWSGLKKESTKKEKKENTDLVGHYLTRESRRETAEQTIATYLGMTPEEKERELRRILISMDLILEVAEKKKCWRAAAMYLKMVDYDGSFLPMSSAARDRWEKTYGRYVDNWEKLEKQQTEKAARTEHPPKPERAERVVSSPARPKSEPVQQAIPVQNSESKIVDNQTVVNETPATSDENNGLIRLRVNVAPIDRIREAVKNPVHEAPVSVPSEAEIQAMAAERARQALQDKLNAAIPGRKFRGQKKRKPGALTPAPGSHKPNSQHVTKGKSAQANPKAGMPLPIVHNKPSNSSQIPDYQADNIPSRIEPGKDPP
jgi:hypothetical protein